MAHRCLLYCRGVATISGLTVQRQDATSEGEGGSAPDPAAADKSQQHKLLLWPQCGQVEQQQLQAALEVAQPQQQTELQLVVLPSTMPAELLMTHHGEVCGRYFADQNMTACRVQRKQLIDVEVT